MGSPHAGHSLLPIILNPMEASHRKAYGITSYLDIITSSITHHSSSLLTSLGVPSVHPSVRPSVRSTNGNKEIPFSIQFSLFFLLPDRFGKICRFKSQFDQYICMYGNVPLQSFCGSKQKSYSSPCPICPGFLFLINEFLCSRFPLCFASYAGALFTVRKVPYLIKVGTMYVGEINLPPTYLIVDC